VKFRSAGGVERDVGWGWTTPKTKEPAVLRGEGECADSADSGSYTKNEICATGEREDEVGEKK